MSFAAPARPSIFEYWITVMAILSQPDALSLSGNLKDFVITSSEVVSFKLYMGETLLLDNRYLPDYNNQLRISVRDIVESHLATDLPSSDTFTQNNVCASFTADIDGTEVNFAAIRCGVRNYSGTAADFLTSNFLTWQPQTVETGYSQPQWLTYYNPGAASVSIKVKFYTKAGGSTVKSLATVAAKSCISVNVQFARIFALDEGDNYGYYDIYVENSAGTRLTYVQRYVLRDEDRNIRCFVFMNSLGGVDCAAFNGHNTYSPRHTYTNAQYSEESIAANIDTERSYTQSTGYVDERSAQWLDDMFNSYGCYVVEEGVVRPIVLDEATVSHNHTEQLHSFEFSYKLSDSSTLLNLPRAEVLPEGLQIETPDQLFFLAPRLVEFPEAELDDSLLFLVQSPYEQNWKKITAGTLISSLQEYFENYSLTFAHTHNNLSVLNKFSESEDGKLLWNGEPIKGQGGGVDPEWQEKVDAAIVDINLLKSWFYEDAETGNIYLAKKNGAARNFVTFGDVVTGEGNEPGGDEPVVGGISSLIVKLGAVSYEGVGTTDVVVNLPAYPTELPASDVYSWAKQPNKPAYTFSEIDNMPSTLSGYGITDAYSKTDIDNKVSALQQAINLLNSWFYEDAETGNIYLAKKNGAARNFVTFGDVVTGEGNEPGGDEPVVGGISSLVVKLGSVSYEGVGTTDVVVNLPAYPTTLPASDVYAWAKQPTKPSYTFSEIGSKPTTLSGYGITDAYTKTEADGRYLKLSGGAMNGDITMTGHALVWDDNMAYDNVPTGLMGVSVVNDSALGYSTAISFKNYYGLQIAVHSAANNFYIRGHNHTQWNSWYELLHTGNIGSFALTPSNYTSTLDSRYARTAYDNNLIYHGNEFNFIPSGYSISIIAINYRTQGGLNGNVSEYGFYNGSGQLSDIVASAVTANAIFSTPSIQVYDSMSTLANRLCLNWNGSYARLYAVSNDGGSLRTLWIGSTSAANTLCYDSSTGRWGIGTVSPLQKFHVSGVIGCDNWIYSYGSVGWYNGTYGGGIYMTDSTWVRVYNDKRFWVNNDIYTTTKVIAVGGYQVGTTPDIGWYPTSGNRICAGSATARGVNVGSLLVSYAWADYTKVPVNGIYCKGNITTPGEVSTGTTSDRRLKCNIVTLSDKDTVTVLNALNPVSFTWNYIAEKLSGGRDAGISRSFVADEFLRVLPNAGRKVWDIYDSIYIEQTIPYLTRGWQIHEQRLQALEEENKSLKEEINRLRRA